MTSRMIDQRMMADVTQKTLGPKNRLNNSATGERTTVPLTTVTIVNSVVSIRTSCDIIRAKDTVDEEKGPGNDWLRSVESQLSRS